LQFNNKTDLTTSKSLTEFLKDHGVNAVSNYLGLTTLPSLNTI